MLTAEALARITASLSELVLNSVRQNNGNSTDVLEVFGDALHNLALDGRKIMGGAEGSEVNNAALEIYRHCKSIREEYELTPIDYVCIIGWLLQMIVEEIHSNGDISLNHTPIPR